MPHLTDKPFILPGPDLLLAGTFDFLLIIPFHGFSLCLCLCAERKGLFVEFEEFFRDALLNRVLPLLIRKMEIPAESAQQCKIDSLGRTCPECKSQCVHRIKSDGKRR